MKKKVKIAIYLIVLLGILAVSLKQIIAAGGTSASIESFETEWGSVEITEELIEDGDNRNVTIEGEFQFKPIEHLRNNDAYLILYNQGFANLCNTWSRYCIEHGKHLSSLYEAIDMSNASLKTKATVNADEEWVGEPIEETMDWDEAYVYTQADPERDTYEENPTQLALWKVLNPNDPEVPSNQIYEDAQKFKRYKEEAGDETQPTVSKNNGRSYKFAYINNSEFQGMIAGPIQIDFQTEFEGLEVGKVGECKLYGITYAGTEEEITEFQYISEDLSEVYTEFPLNETVYIYIPDYTSTYNQYQSISGFEMETEGMDIRAVSYKLQGVLATFFDADGFFHEDSEIQGLSFLKKAELIWKKYKIKIFFGKTDIPGGDIPGGDTPGGDIPGGDVPDVPNVPDWPDWPNQPGNPGEPDTNFPPPTPPTPPTPETPDHRTYIDIGGKVWVDDVVSKDDSLDGKFGTGEDYDRPNVKVTLKYDNGDIVPVGDIAPEAQANFKNPTWTSMEGAYLFAQVPMDKKYYVEFTYDGMMYTTTDFFKGVDVGNYKQNPNDEAYMTVSKAKENENDRKNFNSKFTEIKGTGPDSYAGDYTTIEMDGMKLKYKSKVFATNDSSSFQSRLLTTTNESDVEQEHATGVARPATGTGQEANYQNENYEMTVNTKDSGVDVFPFGEENNLITVWSPEEGQKLNYLKHINLGLKRRPTADLRIAVDIKAGGTSIKDKAKLVTFKSNIEEDDMVASVEDSEVSEYISDEVLKSYTNGTVTQDISGTDYYWYKNYDYIYNQEPESSDLGFTAIQDQLNVYVLYKIILGNQSPATDTKATITGLVDYFSKGLKLPVEEGDQAKIDKIFNRYGANGGYSWIVDGDNIEWTEAGEVNGYNKIENTNLNLELGGSGETKTIYLVLKVAKENNEEVLSQNDLENITEITGYKLYNDEGPMGVVDCDSAPYNATPGNKETYEDDTDDAPMFKLNVVFNTKQISGNVWEEGVNNKVKDVKVELIEYIYKDGEIVGQVVRPGLTVNGEGSSQSIGVETDGEDRTDENGDYSFLVEGGNYAVRFTYGDKKMLETNKKYNAQDYQATNSDELYNSLSNTYGQEGHPVAVATTTDLATYLLNRSQGNVLEIPDELDREAGVQQNWEQNNWPSKTNEYSNARDLTSIRTEVIQSVLPSLTYDNATLLHNLSGNDTIKEEDRIKLTADDRNKIKEGAKNYTYMNSVSEILVIESNDLADAENKVNLALRERPATDIKLEKEITRIRVKLNDGTTIIDTADAKKQANLAKNPLTTDSDNPYESLQTTLMYLDTSTMQDATVDIDYKIKVTNVSEKNDKLSNYIYGDKNIYPGDIYIGEEESIVDEKQSFDDLETNLKELYGTINGTTIGDETDIPIRAKRIFDYVNINLEYRKDDNGGANSMWTKIYDEDDTDTELHSLKEERAILLKQEVQDAIRKTENRENATVSKVIETNENATTSTTDGNLTAGNSAEVTVHLGMSLAEDTGANLENQMVYQNCAEIVEIYPGLGRRDYDIIPGDYIPYSEKTDNGTMDDCDLTGTTTIIPPTGQNRIYYVISVISATIVIAGIVVIKKKVLKK